MILTTHAIVGAAFGRIFPQSPTIAFFIGFASHFIIDALPHWQYRLKSKSYNRENPLDEDMAINKDFLRDLIFIGTDFFLGIILSILIFQGQYDLFNPSPSLLAGALGGVLPDALQFVYFKIRKDPLTSLQKLHVLVHGGDDRHHKQIKWLLLDLGLIILTIAISKAVIS